MKDIFFFFKQKTAYEMRISDWSSDVCSSDLGHGQDPPRRDLPRAGRAQPGRGGCGVAQAGRTVGPGSGGWGEAGPEGRPCGRLPPSLPRPSCGETSMSSAVWQRAPGSPKLAAEISGGLAMNRASPCFGIALLLCLLPAGGIAQAPPAPETAAAPAAANLGPPFATKSARFEPRRDRTSARLNSSHQYA